ncbi:ATP-dependent zinc protease family protein [Legionella steigerwaltii]|nr:RimK/LysX family protein [Legionella steigerwaltii]
MLDVNNRFILNQKNTNFLQVDNDIILSSYKKYFFKLNTGCDLGGKICYDIALIIKQLRKEDSMRSILALFIFAALMTGPVMASNETQIYGYVEKVTFPGKNLTLSAKLDTGAKSASLNATNITEITKNSVPYLRFTVPTKNGDYQFEAEYKGRVKIKVRDGEHGSEILAHAPIKRPVVLLDIQLGDKVRTIKVNLTNRKRFLYPLLLGRDAIIAFNGAVNPALTFTLRNQSLKK